jgi:hypothetical protein
VPTPDIVIRTESWALSVKRIRGDETGAGQQHGAVREFLGTEQIVDQLAERPLDLPGSRLAGKHRFAPAPDLELNAPLTRILFSRPDHNPWTNGAGVRVDLCLGKIEQVLAFDVAGAHVVPDRETTIVPDEFITSASSGSGTFQ